MTQTPTTNSDTPEARTEVTTPEVTTPEVTTPEVTAPEVTAPEVTAPGLDVDTDVVTPDDTSPDEASQHTTVDDEAPATPRRTAVQRLEEEGDVAADYLEELLDITDLDGDIDIDVENGRAAVSIVADATDAVSARALTRLVGSQGQVLEALQELTRLAVQAKTGERTRLMLDIAGFRVGRRADLEKVALAAVASVKEKGSPVTLDPMSPFERKVVHDAVAGAGLRSESEGEGDNRRVVVLPAEA